MMHCAPTQVLTCISKRGKLSVMPALTICTGLHSQEELFAIACFCTVVNLLAAAKMESDPPSCHIFWCNANEICRSTGECPVQDLCPPLLQEDNILTIFDTPLALCQDALVCERLLCVSASGRSCTPEL